MIDEIDPTDHAPTATDERSHDSAVDAEHGHDDGPDALGPVDTQAWGALLLGAALGLIVAVCVGISTSA